MSEVPRDETGSNEETLRFRGYTAVLNAMRGGYVTEQMIIGTAIETLPGLTREIALEILNDLVKNNRVKKTDEHYTIVSQQ